MDARHGDNGDERDLVLALANAYVVTPAGTEWDDVLERIPHDVFHTSKYHCLSGFGQQGDAQAFVYQEGDLSFLWPYLLTPIAAAPGYHDVTSVYGYPGPVGSSDAAFTARAWQALTEHWSNQKVVSAFTRFHPLLANFQMLEGIPAAAAGIREYGDTISIDLTLPPEQHTAAYNKNLRYDLRKAREAGLVTTEDTSWAHTDDFVSVYQDTMSRCGSRKEYIVDAIWVDHFRAALGNHARLFVTRREQSVAAAMIVIRYGGYLHSHLIGTAPEFAAFSPSKLLLDDVRLWGIQNGCHTMHLGGGLGGREDSLFQFKRKFSPRRHSFRTGNWIMNAPVYRDLEEQNRATLAARGINLEDVSYP